MVFGLTIAAIGVLIPASTVVTAPMLNGISVGAGAAAATGGAAATATAVSTGTAVATSVGAGSTAASVAIGAAAGTTGAAIGAVNVAMGPPGWIVLGASERNWTCWKPVIHDESENENGVPLSLILNHEKVKNVVNHYDNLIVENIWNEKFKIYLVEVDNMIAAHAERVKFDF